MAEDETVPEQVNPDLIKRWRRRPGTPFSECTVPQLAAASA